uniref:Uncharacterized protein n=1 Tax=Moniliophthora roreri TaxID=221103 RepID=A0A0W0FDW8_MONRR
MYWPVLFKLGRLLGKALNEWKWVAEHYIKSTLENFWDEFSTLDDLGQESLNGLDSDYGNTVEAVYSGG